MNFAVLNQPDQLATQVNRSRHFPGTRGLLCKTHKLHSWCKPLTWHGLLHYAVLMTPKKCTEYHRLLSMTTSKFSWNRRNTFGCSKSSTSLQVVPQDATTWHATIGMCYTSDIVTWSFELTILEWNGSWGSFVSACCVSKPVAATKALRIRSQDPQTRSCHGCDVALSFAYHLS